VAAVDGSVGAGIGVDIRGLLEVKMGRRMSVGTSGLKEGSAKARVHVLVEIPLLHAHSDVLVLPNPHHPSTPISIQGPILLVRKIFAERYSMCWNTPHRSMLPSRPSSVSDTDHGTPNPACEIDPARLKSTRTKARQRTA
jgi:hypothetical protein